MAVVRVKVVNREKYPDSERNFKDMFTEFKRRVNTSGILHDYKEHQYYESKNQRKRKKKNDAKKKRQMEILEQKIRSGMRVKAPSGVVKKVMGVDKKKRRKYDDSE